MNIGGNTYRGGDRVIVKRRIEENKLAALQTAVQKNFHLGSIAKWEQSSAKLMTNKQQARAQSARRRETAAKLAARREKLRQLLANDDRVYAAEIDSKIETPQQRRERLEKRARELREKRVQRREEFVEKQRLKQFREQCDELRLNHGKNLTMECDRIRKQQMEEKKLRSEYEKTLDSQYLQVWRDELQQKIDRERNESEYRRKLNAETANALRQQIEQMEEQREREKQAQEAKIAQRVQTLREQSELDKVNEAKKQKELERKRQEIMDEYKEYQQRRQAEAEKERTLDKEFVERVLSEQKAENQEKADKQHQNKEDIQNYLAYLQELRNKQEENERLLEQLRQNELEKEWSKREMRWKREELARQQLLQNVLDERSDQIAYKHAMKEKASLKGTSEAQRFSQELNEHNQAEQEKQQERLKYNREIQQFLKKQMEDKKRAEIDGHNDFLAFDVDAEKNNEMYHKLLKQETEKDEQALQAGKTTHHYPKVSANWWTF